MFHKQFVIILCVLCCLSGCTAGKGDTPTNAEEYQYFTFPNTDWGMSQEDVLDAWSLSYSDIAMRPANPDSYYMDIIFQSQEKVTVLGYPADVSFHFSYITRGDRSEAPLGLTSVRAAFEMDSLDTLIDTCKKEYGSGFSPGNAFFSEGKISTLPDAVLRDKVVKFYTDRFGAEGGAFYSENSALSVLLLEQEPDAPYHVRITYGGFSAALTNFLMEQEDPIFPYPQT